MNMKSTAPKYAVIRDEIFEKVSRGKLRPGDQLPTEKEMCALHGVSVITVRQATNALAREGVIRRIPGRGSFILSHTPATPRVAVVLDCGTPGEQGAFDASLLRGVKAALGNDALCLLFDEREVGYLRPGSVNGVLLKNPKKDDLRFSLLRDLQIPHVVIGHASDPRVCCIDNDNRKSAWILGRHLLATGARRLGLLNGPADLTVSDHREEGVALAVAESPGATLTCFHAGAFSRAAGACAMEDARVSTLDGLIAADDQLALGALDQLRRIAAPCPPRFPIACWNDSPATRSTFPQLTVYDIDPEGLGRQAALQLQVLMSGGKPKTTIVPGRLILRDSTCATNTE